MSLEVLSSGPLLSVQDLGFQGHAAVGLGPQGVLDRAATRLANVLVGNPQDAAVLEITWGGAGLRFQSACSFACCGGDLGAQLDGQAVMPDRVHHTRPGSVLRFGIPRRGARAYLALAGGIAVPPLLGSRSTELRSGFGGGFGRALQRGDIVPLGAAPRPAASGYWVSTHWLYPHRPLRILAGDAWPTLTPQARALLLQEPMRVAARSDRMGLRLETTLSATQAPSRLSAALVPGTVQLPPDGQPIVLTRACQTTGGYAPIAHVVSADLDRLAQLRPGHAVQFQLLDLAQAQALWARREAALEELVRAVTARASR